MSTMPSLDEDAMMAAFDLVGRAGARELQVGYLHDDVPVAEALARRLLTGAMCRCGRLVALSSAGGVFYPGATYPDGQERTEADVRAAGTCRWTREAARWVGACGAGR
mgnify:FL=1